MHNYAINPVHAVNLCYCVANHCLHWQGAVKSSVNNTKKVGFRHVEIGQVRACDMRVNACACATSLCVYAMSVLML